MAAGHVAGPNCHRDPNARRRGPLVCPRAARDVPPGPAYAPRSVICRAPLPPVLPGCSPAARGGICIDLFVVRGDCPSGWAAAASVSRRAHGVVRDYPVYCAGPARGCGKRGRSPPCLLSPLAWLHVCILVSDSPRRAAALRLKSLQAGRQGG